MQDMFETGIQPLCEATDRFPWENKDAYALYLAQTYYYLIHSTRLLGAGAARFNADEEALHRRYLDHAREEKSHHLLAKKDLENLGYRLDSYSELSVTRQVYEPQYYKIEHLDPTALFGYIFALEGVSAKRAGQICKTVENCHGKSAAGFLRVHGNEDPDHLDQAFKSIAGLEKRRLKHIHENFSQSCYSLALFFDEVAVAATKAKRPKAA